MLKAVYPPPPIPSPSPSPYFFSIFALLVLNFQLLYAFISLQDPRLAPTSEWDTCASHAIVTVSSLAWLRRTTLLRAWMFT